MSNKTRIDAEKSLRETWSIGPLRPWLKMLAERQLSQKMKSKLDASDVVQQTLVDAWKGQADFRGTSHRERLAWLKTIMTRVMIRFNRDQFQTEKRGMGREKTIQSAMDDVSVRIEQLAIGRETGPVSAAARAEQSLLLAAALGSLPNDYRQVLTMRHIDGLSHAEIAEKLGRTSAATRMLWVRALEALKKQIGASGSTSSGQG